MFNIGPLELILIFVVALIVIGPKRLPELARALGKAMAEFKKATSELQSSLELDIKSHKETFRPVKKAPSKTNSSEQAPQQTGKQAVVESTEQVDTKHTEKTEKKPTTDEENNFHDR